MIDFIESQFLKTQITVEDESNTWTLLHKNVLLLENSGNSSKFLLDKDTLLDISDTLLLLEYAVPIVLCEILFSDQFKEDKSGTTLPVGMLFVS